MTNKVLHAFPSPSAFTPDGDTLESGYNGMTLRDYFAAKAMAALLSRSGPYGEDQEPICREDVFTVDELAEYAYAQADAMLTIRSLPDNAIYRDKTCSITSPDQPSKQPLPHASRA